MEERRVVHSEPTYFSMRITKRINETAEHLFRTMNAVCVNTNPWGWFGIYVTPEYILIRGVYFNYEIMLQLGRMLGLTSRHYTMEIVTEDMISEIRNFNFYLNLYPMGPSLIPLGNTVIAQALHDDESPIAHVEDHNFVTGMSIKGKVIAVGPECKQIREGQIVYLEVAPNTVFKYDWGYVMQVIESRVGVHVN